MEFYAYIHCKPDGVPFYVGKGKLVRAVSLSAARNTHHKNIVFKYGKENIRVCTLGCSSEEIAFDLERGLIKCLRKMGVDLCNYTDGGDGPMGAVRSADTRKKLSDAHKGKRMAPEVRAKMVGRHLSDAAKAKVSAANKGKITSAATKAKMSMAHTGKTMSAAARAKMSMAKRNPSPETRAKMAAAQLGKTQSAETKAKRSAALKSRKKN